jgi:hypothetical protein
MAELIDVHQEFHLGNRFIFDVAENMSKFLPDEYRVIVKYDRQAYHDYSPNFLNVLLSTSCESHNLARDFFDENVHAIFQNYFHLNKWSEPVHNNISYPLPIGTFVDVPNDINIKPLQEREFDFCFIGQIPHTGTRDCFKRNIDSFIKSFGNKYKYKIHYTNSFNDGLSHNDYLEILNSSKISLCPCGAFSSETFRFFESIRMGSFPVVDFLPKFWYYEGAPFFLVKWFQIEKTIPLMLQSLENGYNHTEHVSRYMDEILNPKNLANILSQILLKRDSIGIDLVKRQIEKTRTEMKKQCRM